MLTQHFTFRPDIQALADVDVFLVISDYLITFILIQKKAQPDCQQDKAVSPLAVLH
jgi:hypothetical protein